MGVLKTWASWKQGYGFKGVVQWFSTFLMLGSFNTVPHVVMTLNHKIVFVATLYSFASTMIHSAETCVSQWSEKALVKSCSTPGGTATRR